MLNPRTDSLQRAIAVVTAWLDQTDEPGGSTEYQRLVAETQAEDVEQGVEGRLVAGLVSLAGLLTTHYAEMKDTDPNTLLAALSLMIEDKDI
jgi:hypothetical protein